MKKKIHVELCTSEEDWLEIRSCLARGFFNYPLYKYIIPNPKNREQFLEQFLEANYDVAVRNGNSVVISICLVNELADDVVYEKANTKSSSDNIIIGGVMMVPPTEDGTKWDCADDETYDEAYIKHGLGDIDNGAFERLLNYEEWEDDFLCSKICELRLQLWQAYFWGIDPDYSGMGYGSASYANCIRLIDGIHAKNFAKKTGRKHKEKICDGFESDDIMINKKKNTATSNKAQISVIAPKKSLNFSNVKQEICFKQAIVLNLSHSVRAAKFHERNGNVYVTSIPVMGLETIDAKSNDHPNVYVLFVESYNSGQLDNVKTQLVF